jgi:hypothetical protein
MKYLFILLLLPSLFANDMVGTVVRIEGEAELLINPSESFSQDSSKVLLNGKYYNLGLLKLGTKIENGQVIRTSQKGKIKIIYKNGDQHIIGPTTAFEISWTQSNKEKTPTTVVNLMYGVMRGIVDKNGPRSGSQVKTKNTVMGVRGTDFFINSGNSQSKTEFTVLRGEIEVALETNKDFFKVPSGQTLEVVESSSAQKSASMGITGQDALKEINQNTSLKKMEVKAEETISQSLSDEIVTLENLAVQKTLEDIKRYDEKLYEQLKKKSVNSSEEINLSQVLKLQEKAPQTTKKKAIDLNTKTEDLYKKYQQ